MVTAMIVETGRHDDVQKDKSSSTIVLEDNDFTSVESRDSEFDKGE